MKGGKTDNFNALWSAHKRNEKTLKGAKRKIKMLRFMRFVAWALIGFDAWFSYNVILVFSDSQEFALFAAVFIAAVQWIISNAIFTRTMGDFMRIDKDGDGNASFAEWTRWGITALAILSAYGLDIVTNVVGVDELGFGALLLAVPGVPDYGFIAVAFTYLFAALLCFGDEILQYLADDAMAHIERELPRLKQDNALLEAQMRKAGAFGETVIHRAEEEGQKAGANARI